MNMMKKVYFVCLLQYTHCKLSNYDRTGKLEAKLINIQAPVRVAARMHFRDKLHGSAITPKR